MKFLHAGKRLKMQNKKGGMLVLVLIIFAVSLILVSSALTITIASRSRYYVDAEMSQERLTLVCAAETMIDALENQELTDKMLENSINSELTIRGANTTSPSSSAAPTDGKAIAPGLAGSGTSTTKCKVTRDSASKDLFLDFSTLIDATGRDQAAEKLRVRLKYTPPPPTPDLCANMVTAGEDGATNNSPKLVVSDPRSFTVFHGNAVIAGTSGSYIHNRAIFTGILKGGQGTVYYNDVIFYGPKAGYDISSGGNGIAIQGSHNMYFLGVAFEGQTGRQHVFVNSDGSAASAPGLNLGSKDGQNTNTVHAYFHNAEINIPSSSYTMANNYCQFIAAGTDSKITISRNWGDNIIYDATGNPGAVNAPSQHVFTSATASDDVKTKYTTIKAKADQYMAAGGEVDSAATHKVPSSSDMAGYAQPTSGSLAGGTYSNRTSTVDGGVNYAMSGNFSHGILNIDLSKGSSTIMINSEVHFLDFFIKVDNSYENTLTIVLAKNAKLICDDSCGYCKDTKRTCGIISVPHVSEAWEQVEGKANTPNPCRAISGEKPACYVIGLGGNRFEAGRACTVDAYISLGGRAEEGDSPSTVCLKDFVNFYGRVEAVNFDQGGSDNLTMNYCPSPAEGSDKPKPLSTRYTAEEYQFYY